MPPILLLIPTESERGLVKERLDLLKTQYDAEVAACGFGPVLPAAITTEKIQQHSPPLVILCGIAGANEAPSMQVGAAYEFSKIKIDGVGVGQGTEFKTPSQMGWDQFAGDANRPGIGDEIDVGSSSGLSLLTVCAAAGDRKQANDRHRRYATDAEDMEAFAVAAACQLQKVPLRVVRGISNIAGDRDHAKWKIADAMNSAIELVQRIIEEEIADV
jgi:futalosine hydrolase